MKKYLIFSLSLLAVLFMYLTYTSYRNKDVVLDNVKLKDKISNKEKFAIMLEQQDGTYLESQTSTFPNNMLFNSTKSGCVDDDGNIIPNSVSYSGGKVTISTRKTSYCYMYFDRTNCAGSGTVTVHNDSVSNQYIPIRFYYLEANHRSEAVYPSTDFSGMAGCLISSIKFYTTTASKSDSTPIFQFYLTEVEGTTISSFVESGTTVYEGSITIANNELLVTFETPYMYMGGNLLLGMYHAASTGWFSNSFYGETVTGASIYLQGTSTTPTQNNFLPKATFTYY